MLRIVQSDNYLMPYSALIEKRHRKYLSLKKRLAGGRKLSEWACSHLYYGAHRTSDGWVFREWAPNAKAIYLISDLSGWKADERFSFRRLDGTDDWEMNCPEGAMRHGMLYKLLVRWPGGEGERIPSHAVRVVQDNDTKIFSAQLWAPDKRHEWKYPHPVPPSAGNRTGKPEAYSSKAGRKSKSTSFLYGGEVFPGRAEPLIVYEAHIGMAQEEGRTGTFPEFEKNVLPVIEKSGYNTIQFMALMEHPYYGSFGYQVSNFFALSSRFGTPEEFKSLVDACHRAGIRVVMDIVHSHSVKNENEGLSRFDGTDYQYFHAGPRGYHPAWDSRLFDYGRDRVLHFLLSNCAFWLGEYNLDGFRFDGVTSMLYMDHGLGRSFSGYDDYFSDNFDTDAALYLALANTLIHEMRPDAVTISEDMSGYPGMAFPVEDGGLGFDYRLAMGIPDFWIKIIKEKPDEKWSPGEIWYELGNRRQGEKNIAYCESHDQALVGDKTIAFRLMDREMYSSMSMSSGSIVVDRGIALHKIIRLLTFSLGGEGYLNFMGNEFGHPEWIDFPREGNGWSYHYARRQWSLLRDSNLRYRCLADFDRAMIASCASVLADRPAEAVKIDEGSQVLSWKRGGLLFAVNLNPSVSFTDFEIPSGEGEFELVLNSDSPAFNGFGRVPEKLALKAIPRGERHAVTPYLPSRCALVFRIIQND